MKKIFKSFLLAEVILLIFCVCGWNFKNKIQTEKDNVKDIAVEIIECIENNKRNDLKVLFSFEAAETKDFDDGMDYIYDTYTGSCEKVDDCGTHIRDSFYSGKQAKVAFSYFDIITTDSEYVLYFEYFLKDEINNNQNKIEKMKLVQKSDIIDEYNYNYGEKYERLGIYNPDWDDE